MVKSPVLVRKTGRNGAIFFRNLIFRMSYG
nr:MAG TPA: hypothetical protein [Bacteriophage sp.]